MKPEIAKFIVEHLVYIDKETDTIKDRMRAILNNIDGINKLMEGIGHSYVEIMRAIANDKPETEAADEKDDVLS